MRGRGHSTCVHGVESLQWMKRHQESVSAWVQPVCEDQLPSPTQQQGNCERDAKRTLHVVKSRISFHESTLFFFLKSDFNIWFYSCFIHSKSYLEKWVPNLSREIFNTFLEIQLQLCLLVLLYINPTKKKGNWVSQVWFTFYKSMLAHRISVVCYNMYSQRIPKYNF